jgi:hypothetical protein
MTIYLYIKKHKITGLKYLGITSQEDPHKYTGSGKRWLRHLKKHGYEYTTDILLATENKKDIERTGLFFSMLWNIVKSSDWANLTEERGNGGDMGFSGLASTREKMSNSHKKKVKEGTHHLLCGDIQKQSNKKRIDEGTHNLLGNNNPSHKRVADGTHHFLDISWQKSVAKSRTQKAIDNGNHYFSSDLGKENLKAYQQKRVVEGSHNFLGEKNPSHDRIKNKTHNFLGSISCRDKTGNCVQISKDIYYRQTGPMEDWEYVVVRSKEGKKRKELLTKC